MAFYCPDRAMAQHLQASIASLEAADRPGLSTQLSVTWLRYDSSLIDAASHHSDLESFWAQAPAGASWRGEQGRYPASVVKLLYLVSSEAWLQQQLLEASDELRDALEAMIRHSSNDATGLVMDLLSGTTSGPALPDGAFQRWAEQRQLVNQWCQQLEWPEWRNCNACQKTWSDGPYGRDRQLYGSTRENRNRLTSDFTARLLHGVISGALVSPLAGARMRDLLLRPLDAAARNADPDNQVDGFLGAALPEGARLWSKAGWMSEARHDAAYIEAEGQAPMLLVAFTAGKERSEDTTLLPALCTELMNH